MGYLATYFRTNPGRPRNLGDLLNMLSHNRGVANVRVRLTDPSSQWDGLYFVDADDAQALVGAGLARLEP
jgi:hypothetical protein